ncbi:MAG: hypothetical protein RL385_662, partial [Pseudomonadota bacterium]
DNFFSPLVMNDQEGEGGRRRKSLPILTGDTDHGELVDTDEGN